MHNSWGKTTVRRWFERTAGATLAAALIAQPSTVTAQPASGVTGISAALPALPSVPPSITDGQSVQSLFDRAIAPVPQGDQPSLTNGGIGSAGLPVSQVTAPPSWGAQLSTALPALARTQGQLVVVQVRLNQSQNAARAAGARAAASMRQARRARAAYHRLDGALRQLALRLYTAGGPEALAPDPTAGAAAVFASGYADTAFPITVIAARRHDAAVQAQEQSAARSARQEVGRDLAETRTLQRAERTVLQKLHTQLSSLPSNMSAWLAGQGAELAAQAGAHLTSASAFEFTPTNSLSTPVTTTTVALAWAFAQLGKPYQWGATGPGTFDCSGLTQYVWRQAGVQIPRVAADQYSWTIPVPLSQLLPGDLVFFGQTDIHHVGIYIGDGLMINAPHTGDVVRVSSIWWSDLAGFGRVHAAGVPVPRRTPPSVQQPAPAAVLPAAGPVPSQTRPPPGSTDPGPSAPPPTRTTSRTTTPTPSTTGTTTTTTPAATSTTNPPSSTSTTTASATSTAP